MARQNVRTATGRGAGRGRSGPGGDPMDVLLLAGAAAGAALVLFPALALAAVAWPAWRLATRHLPGRTPTATLALLAAAVWLIGALTGRPAERLVSGYVDLQ